MILKAEYLKVKFILGSVTLAVGLVAAIIALYHWVERTGIQYLLGDYARYVLGFGGFAAMIFGAMLINDAYVLRKVLKGKYVFSNPTSTLPHNKIVVPKRKNKKRGRKND